MEWIDLTNKCIVKMIMKTHVVMHIFYIVTWIGVLRYHKETRIREYGWAAWSIGLTRQREGKDSQVRLLAVGSQICHQLPLGLWPLVLGLRDKNDWGFAAALTETEYWGEVLCFRVTVSVTLLLQQAGREGLAAFIRGSASPLLPLSDTFWNMIRITLSHGYNTLGSADFTGTIPLE